MCSDCLQWQRQANDELELFVYENNKWKHYTESKNFVIDSLEPGASRGFNTFQKCFKLGYKIIATDK